MPSHAPADRTLIAEPTRKRHQSWQMLRSVMFTVNFGEDHIHLAMPSHSDYQLRAGLIYAYLLAPPTGEPILLAGLDLLHGPCSGLSHMPDTAPRCGGCQRGERVREPEARLWSLRRAGPLDDSAGTG
jgi:hypothetical protein